MKSNKILLGFFKIFISNSFGILFFLSICFAQQVDSTIIHHIDMVDSVRLSQHVRILSGIDSTQINDANTLIISRKYDTKGHDYAVEYLKNIFKEYGYSVYALKEIYLPYLPYSRMSYSIQNIIATKQGNSDEYFILGAHYDSYSPDSLAPGADDNSSGVAAILEAARILKNTDSEYTIKFILWDAEEKGCIGSQCYIDKMIKSGDKNLKAVINIDMIAYICDSLSPGAIDAVDSSNSVWYGNHAYSIATNYLPELSVILNNQATGSSDHASFWEYGYNAIFIHENHNTSHYPYIHTNADVMSNFNIPFFLNMTKFIVATISELAGSSTNSIDQKITPILSVATLHPNYPNPFNNSTIISYSISNAGITVLDIYDLSGRSVATLVNEFQSPGKYLMNFDASGLSSGIYLYRIKHNESIETRRMMLLK